MVEIQRELEEMRRLHREEGAKMKAAVGEIQYQLEAQYEAIRRSFENHVINVHDQKVALDVHLQQARNISGGGDGRIRH